MNRAQFLKLSGLNAATLDIWIEQRWVVPADADDPYTDIDMARVRLINELRHDMGANDAGIDIILHLLDQLHGMRRALDDIRLELGSARPVAKRATRSTARRPGKAR